MNYISLFTGAGGLDLGLEAAGFKTRVCVEIDDDARATLKLNRPRWRIFDPGDIYAITPEEIVEFSGLSRGDVALLSGGPPCQPFSKSSYWVSGDAPRLADPRANTLLAYLAVVRAALPQVILLENVRGISFRGKDEGIQLLGNEFARINREAGTRYHLQEMHINAADYGVPQIRERVFILADRDGRTLEMPTPTHFHPGQPDNTSNDSREPYLTAWDAIGDLDENEWDGELALKGKWAKLLPSIPEGKNYLWHTDRGGGKPLFGWRTRFWSFLLKLAKNQPSWTLQAHPGPATGPFHWKDRLLSEEELCNLQTFPKGYKVVGSRGTAQRLIGNAVPSALGELVGLEIRRQFFGARVRRQLRLIPQQREGCPPPEPLKRIPKKYMNKVGNHTAHPGVGRGPGALKRKS